MKRDTLEIVLEFEMSRDNNPNPSKQHVPLPVAVEQLFIRPSAARKTTQLRDSDGIDKTPTGRVGGPLPVGRRSR